MADIRLGVVGTGFIASHFMKSLDRHEGLRVDGILTRRERNEVTGLPDALLTTSIDDLVAHCDLVVECSGDPIWATDVVTAAVGAERPVVTMNTEFHITTGSAFVGKGLVTEAEGDQPGCLAALHEDAVAMGFTPIVYGNMKGFLNHDPARDDMEFWGAKQGISLPMVTSFTDGTKVQAEQVLVGNHFGATIATEGMLGPDVSDIVDAADKLAAAAHESGRPISDFVVSSGLPHGVFIVATHDEAHREALDYYKLGPGPNYTLIKNNILVHLEIVKTIRRVLSGGGVLLDNSAQPELSLAAIAKRDLMPGELIDNAIGSFDLRGHAVRIEEHPGHVPIGLISQARVTQPVERGEIVTTSVIEFPESRARTTWSDQILPSALAAR